MPLTNVLPLLPLLLLASFGGISADAKNISTKATATDSFSQIDDFIIYGEREDLSSDVVSGDNDNSTLEIDLSNADDRSYTDLPSFKDALKAADGAYPPFASGPPAGCRVSISQKVDPYSDSTSVIL